MLNDYKVTFKRSNGTIGQEIFTTNSASEARHDFKECYRHDIYNIISTDKVFYYELENEYIPESEVYQCVDDFINEHNEFKTLSDQQQQKARKIIFNMVMSYSGEGYHPTTYLNDEDEEGIQNIIDCVLEGE